MRFQRTAYRGFVGGWDPRKGVVVPGQMVPGCGKGQGHEDLEQLGLGNVTALKFLKRRRES